MLGNTNGHAAGQGVMAAGTRQVIAGFLLGLLYAAPLFANEAGAQDPAPVWHIQGPIIERVSRDTAWVRWQTEQPSIGHVLVHSERAEERRFESPDASTQHAVVIDQVPEEGTSRIRVLAKIGQDAEIDSGELEFDAMLHYVEPPLKSMRPNPYPDDEKTVRYERLARRMLDAACTSRGYCLVLGSADGRLAYHLAQVSDFQILVVDPDANYVATARAKLDEAGLYGVRVSVHQARFDELPFGVYLANLIVSDSLLDGGEWPAALEDIYPVLRPSGGTLFLESWQSEPAKFQDQLTSWIGEVDLGEGESRIEQDQAPFWIHRRGKLPGAGEWTHQYGSADNSSCSQDELIRGPMSVLWWGRPGPRPMPDRGPRNPAPVSAGGNLFVQGNRTLFGLDAYNGTLLWFKQIPTMRRANIPRDCSNMVVTDDYLYLAHDSRCWGFAARTGEWKLNFRLPESYDAADYEWGYLATVGDLLLGSCTPRDSTYLGDQGEWFEHFGEDDVGRVVSHAIFCSDRHTGKPRWEYQGGAILNSTLTIAHGVMYFIESRHPDAVQTSQGRLLGEPLQEEQYLVALDLRTGEQRWSRSFDFSDCQYMTYLAQAEGVVLVTGSDEEKKYHTFAFRDDDGSPLWENHEPARKHHHSGHLAHPVLIGNRVYLNKLTYDLYTGKVLAEDDFDWHGCGVMSASRHTIFHRFEFHGMLDLHTQERTEFLGVRSGCWLSMIPSGGLLLAPESSAGCSCTHALQTTLAYVPRHLDARLKSQSEPGASREN